MTNPTNNLIKTLTSKGLVGVMIALVLLAGSAIWILYKITGNHIEHSTQAWKNQTQATIQQTAVMSELSTLIKLKLE